MFFDDQSTQPFNHDEKIVGNLLHRSRNEFEMPLVPCHVEVPDNLAAQAWRDASQGIPEPSANVAGGRTEMR